MRETRKEKLDRKQEGVKDLLEGPYTRIEEIRKESVLELEDLEDMIAESL